MFQVCFAFDVLGVFLCLLLLVLSAVRRGSQWNAGPRIFTVNLMLVNLLHAGCGVVVHGGFVFDGIKSALGRKYRHRRWLKGSLGAIIKLYSQVLIF